MTHARRFLPFPALLFALLPLLLVSCGGSGGGGSPTDPGVQSVAGVESALYQLVNQARVDAGLDPLANDPAIAAVARQHSEEMRDLGYFSHIDPQGLDVAGRFQAAGIQFTTAGENLIRVENATNPASYANDRLLASPVHRANILDPRFTRIGIGAARQGSIWWITENFAN